MVFFKLDFVSKIKRLLLFIKSIRVELGISYNKEVTDICKVSKIKLGIIPNLATYMDDYPTLSLRYDTRRYGKSLSYP